MAALLIVAIAMLSVIPTYLALKTDDDVLDRDREEISRALTARARQLEDDQRFALQQASRAAQGLDGRPGLPFLADLGRILTGKGGHQLVVIVPDDGTPPQSYSSSVEPSATLLRSLVSDIAPLIRQNRNTPFRLTPRSDTPMVAASTFGYVDIAGRPSMAVASRIVDPSAKGPALINDATLVSIVILNTKLFRTLERETGVHNVHLNFGKHDLDQPMTVPLTDPNGNIITSLTWHRHLQGQDLIHKAVPLAIAGVIIIALLVLLILYIVTEILTRLRASETRAFQEALTDPLTGLANRFHFTRQLDALLRDRSPGQPGPGIAYIDVDQFKQYNETLGHAFGDIIIEQVGERLKNRLAEDEIAARLGADEFAVIFPDAAGADEMKIATQHLIEIASTPLIIEDHVVDLTVAAGSAVAPRDGESAPELMRRAEIALHNAKRDKSRCTLHFQPSMEENVRQRQEIVSDLRHAIAHNELSLAYQPLMTPDGKRAIGVEALLRWNHPERGNVSPAVFVPIAEEHRLISDIGRWVLATACRDAAAWPHLTLAVNISPLQLRRSEFLEELDDILEADNFDPTRLEAEVTENVVLDQADTASAAFDALHHRGIRVALDDFGTGYSSLSYLERFRFDKIKIDRSFLRNIETSRPAAAIVHTVIALGDALDMTITAEGVETPGQHRFLQAAGCHQLQGFLFSRPVAADVITNRYAGGTEDRSVA